MAWSNWSGSVTSRGQVATPRSPEELAALVRSAGQVRATGAGHSFTPVCDSDDTIISLSHMEGALSIDRERETAWAPAGWSLARLTEALWTEGFSLANQGDVNPQSLAGAVGTGTHGTGRSLGSLSTMARGFRLTTADGETIEISEAHNPGWLDGARLSLGMLGVVTEIEIDVVPAYGLIEQIELRPVDALLEDYHSISGEERHGEFFVFPYARTAFYKTLTMAPPPADNGPGSDFGEGVFRTACKLGRRLPALVPGTQRLMMRLSQPTRRSGPAFRIFPSDRTVRFEEMEYHFGQGAGLAALAEARRHVQRRRLPVTFPFEMRTIAGDTIWLSPFKAGVNESISFHQYAPMDWRKLFAEIEPIFRDFGGRPHWGKRHTLSRGDVDRLHPEAERFRVLRRKLDPAGKFLNAHLRPLFD